MIKKKKLIVKYKSLYIRLFYFCVAYLKKKTVLNLRISHAKKLLFSSSEVPEFMISCEYIRILKYCMYISTTERRLPFINYSE